MVSLSLIHNFARPVSKNYFKQVWIKVQKLTSNCQAQLIVSSLVEHQLSCQFDGPFGSEARGQEVIQLNPRIAQDKIGNWSTRLAFLVMGIECAEPPWLAVRCGEIILQRREVFVSCKIRQ